MNTEATSDVNKHTFQEEVCTAFDFLMQNWLKISRDPKTTEAILTTLVPMISLLPEQQDSERIVKLIPVCLNLSKKRNVRLAAVRLVLYLFGICLSLWKSILI